MLKERKANKLHVLEREAPKTNTTNSSSLLLLGSLLGLAALVVSSSESETTPTLNKKWFDYWWNSSSVPQTPELSYGWVLDEATDQLAWYQWRSNELDTFEVCSGTGVDTPHGPGVDLGGLTTVKLRFAKQRDDFLMVTINGVEDPFKTNDLETLAALIMMKANISNNERFKSALVYQLNWFCKQNKPVISESINEAWVKKDRLARPSDKYGFGYLSDSDEVSWFHVGKNEDRHVLYFDKGKITRPDDLMPTINNAIRIVISPNRSGGIEYHLENKDITWTTHEIVIDADLAITGITDHAYSKSGATEPTDSSEFYKLIKTKVTELIETIKPKTVESERSKKIKEYIKKAGIDEDRGWMQVGFKHIVTTDQLLWLNYMPDPSDATKGTFVIYLHNFNEDTGMLGSPASTGSWFKFKKEKYHVEVSIDNFSHKCATPESLAYLIMKHMKCGNKEVDNLLIELFAKYWST